MVIDVDDVTVSDVDADTVVRIISEITGVDSGSLTVDVIVDEDGRVTQIIVAVDGGETVARVVSDAVNDIDKGAGCQAGVLCRSRYARLETDTLSFSGVNSVRPAHALVAALVAAAVSVAVLLPSHL